MVRRTAALGPQMTDPSVSLPAYNYYEYVEGAVRWTNAWAHNYFSGIGKLDGCIAE